MNIRYFIIGIAVSMCTAINANAQSFLEKMLDSVIKGAAQGIETGTLQKYINDPSLQSADMANYLSHYRKGDALMAEQDYYNAAQNYASAWIIATRTNDQYLKILWTKYGWAQDTNKKLANAKSLAGIDTSTYGGSADYSSGYTNSSGSSTTTTTTSSRKCSLCKGTGLKIKESYVGHSQRKYCTTCGKEVMGGHSHVRCDLCNGTGILNY